jgi:hypothetical protein
VPRQADSDSTAQPLAPDHPSEIYGRIKEGVHIAGYSAERAFDHLEWLLTDDRWRQVGPGFDDVNAFLDSVRLDNFRILADQRKSLVRKIKELQPSTTYRAISKMLRVDHKTVGRDIGENSSRGGQEPQPNQGHTGENSPRQNGVGEKSPPSSLGGAEAARMLECVAGVEADRKRSLNTGVAMQPFDLRGHDLYQTPVEAVQALLKVESFCGPIWEPACGRSGNIARVLREAGHKVIATDLVNYEFEFPDAKGGIDFLLEQRAPESVKTIVTNPPYKNKQADCFVRHALELVPRVVMILGLPFLGSDRRSDILDDERLARVYIFRNRVRFFRDGCEEQDRDPAIVFAWMVWERDHRGPWQGQRISWEPEPCDDAEPQPPTREPQPPQASRAEPAPQPPAVDDDGIPDFLDRRTPR